MTWDDVKIRDAKKTVPPLTVNILAIISFLPRLYFPCVHLQLIEKAYFFLVFPNFLISYPPGTRGGLGNKFTIGHPQHECYCGKPVFKCLSENDFTLSDGIAYTKSITFVFISQSKSLVELK